MGRFTYYSPLLAGFALAALMHDSIWSAAAGRYSEKLYWVLVFLVGLQLAIAFQLLMVGSQGVFAQVLPVPGGRSIRGGPAVLGGFLIWMFLACGGIALMLAGAQMHWMPIVLGVIALAAGAGAVVCYVWGWPTAVRDFADRN